MLNKEKFVVLSEHINNITNFLSNCQSEENSLKERLKKIEQELTDINHEIEFGQMSRRERSKIYNKIKDLRLERRYIKNILELLAAFTSSSRDQAKIIQMLSNIGNKTKEVLNLQDSRTYGARTSFGKISSKIVGQHFEIKKINNNYKVGLKHE